MSAGGFSACWAHARRGVSAGAGVAYRVGGVSRNASARRVFYWTHTQWCVATGGLVTEGMLICCLVVPVAVVLCVSEGSSLCAALHP